MRVPDKWYAARKCVKGEDSMKVYPIGSSTYLPVERLPVSSKGLMLQRRIQQRCRRLYTGIEYMNSERQCTSQPAFFLASDVVVSHNMKRSSRKRVSQAFESKIVTIGDEAEAPEEHRHKGLGRQRSPAGSEMLKRQSGSAPIMFTLVHVFRRILSARLTEPAMFASPTSGYVNSRLQFSISTRIIPAERLNSWPQRVPWAKIFLRASTWQRRARRIA